MNGSWPIQVLVLPIPTTYEGALIQLLIGEENYFHGCGSATAAP